MILPNQSEEISLMQTIKVASIDWAACVRMYHGDPDFARELLVMLAKDLRTVEKKLAIAYTKQDIKCLRAELHRLRGAVSYLKLPQLESTLKLFHEALKEEPQNPNRFAKTYADLQQAIATFWETWEALE